MIAIEKIMASFITLPGSFLIIWTVIMLYILIKSRAFLLKLLTIFTFILMVLTFTGLGVRIFLFPLENYAEYNQEFYTERYPVVVLGGGMQYGVNHVGAELNSISLQRLVEAYMLYNKLGGKIIPTGGTGVSHHNIAEADIAGRWLQKMGVPGEDIVLEKQAQTTYENGVYVQKWLHKHGYEKIYLVTSAVHIPRSMAVFKNLNIKLIPVPAGYMYNHKLGWLDYLPNRFALTANMSALHEWLGIIWYKINGRI